jgi:hypothetical protein
MGVGALNRKVIALSGEYTSLATTFGRETTSPTNKELIDGRSS